jgi:hypothetical protein
MKNGILTLIAFVTLPIAASAQELWRKTTHGMSPNEVREILPETLIPTRPEKLVGGAIERLRIEQVVLVQSTFSAHFFFIGEKLEQVTLSLKTSGGDTFGTRLVTFDSLVDVLRAKYGAELSKKKKEDGGFRRADAVWISGKTNINLLLLDAYGSLSLNLVYQVRLSREAEKI